MHRHERQNNEVDELIFRFVNIPSECFYVELNKVNKVVEKTYKKKLKIRSKI